MTQDTQSNIVPDTTPTTDLGKPIRKSRVTLPEDKVAKLREEYLAGKSAADLAKDYGISVPSVYTKVKGLGSK